MLGARLERDSHKVLAAGEGKNVCSRNERGSHKVRGNGEHVCRRNCEVRWEKYGVGIWIGGGNIAHYFIITNMEETTGPKCRK